MTNHYPERAAFDAIDWLDDFVARCNGDDRGSCESVNVVRSALQARSGPNASHDGVAVPEGWREFIEDCTTTAGSMVNGNRLSIRAAELLAAAPTPPASDSTLSVPDECPHMIVFDDAEREPIIFAGAGARDAALKTWEKVSGSWNAHLFVRIERNSRDDRYPSASIAPPAADAVPVSRELLDILALEGLSATVTNQRIRAVLDLRALLADGGSDD